MNDAAANKLPVADDPSPVECAGDVAAPAPFLFIGDHAGARIPARLADLGLPPAERRRHIAIDIGVEPLGRALSRRLHAPFLLQRYSRLVIDCNRRADAPGAIPAISDGTRIPGNADLSPQQRTERVAAIHEPYHAAIGDALDARERGGRRTILVALHSFTPVMGGRARPWDYGVLHDGREDAFALKVLALLRARPTLTVGDNEPYRMDETDYTVPNHAYPRRLSYVELEVRQDLLVEEAGIAAAADLLADVLTAAATSLSR